MTSHSISAVVSTTEHTISGECVFRVTSQGKGQVRPVIENHWYTIDTDQRWDNTESLYRDVSQWATCYHGSEPRDEDDRVIPFPQE